MILAGREQLEQLADDGAIIGIGSWNRIKHFRLNPDMAEMMRSLPAIPQPEHYVSLPVVPFNPKHEQTSDSGFGLLRYPPRTMVSGGAREQYPGLSRDGAGL